MKGIKMTAFRQWEDGKQWLRIIDDNGNEYQEPIAGWTEILNLTNGELHYRHIDDRLIKSA